MLRKIFSQVVLTLLLIGTWTLAFTIRPVKSDWTWTETIYIRPDGSVEPDTAPISTVDNVTYTLIDNIVGDVPEDSYAIVVERTNIIVDGVGYMVRGEGNGTGVFLSGRDNVTIKNMEIKDLYYGIVLSGASDNNIFGNNITGGSLSSYNIFVRSSSNNCIYRNNIKKGFYGIGLDLVSCSNSIYRNDITAAGKSGIFMDSGSNNSIYENNIANNLNGADNEAANNRYYHNNFIQNIHSQVKGYGGVWDDGYPSGGNYWSDYNGTDFCSGPYQNETGSDGMGDTSYIISETNRDRYPLMKRYPWGQHDIGITSTTKSKTVLGQNFTMQINITTFNYGNHSETFNITIYANDTILHTFMNINLLGRNSTAKSYDWNTTGFVKGNYTISAYVTPVAGETYLTDNNFTDGWVIVAMVGDITGPDDWPDGECEMRDVGLVARHFGENVPPGPANCDITGREGKPDCKIDMRDVGIVARHFGEIDP